jgi:condensin complex subunit 2
VLNDKATCHSLAGFFFSKDAFSFDDTATFLAGNTGAGANDDDDDDDFGGEAFNA